MANDQEAQVITLYVGDHCSLCDKAKAVIHPLLDANWQLQEVNIKGDQLLQERYGISIPVAAFSNGTEKGWPFTAGQIKKLMENESD